MMTGSRRVYAGLFGALLVAGGLLPTNVVAGTKSTTSGQATQKSVPKASAVMPSYEIVDQDRYDAPVKTEIQVSAVMSGTITEAGVRALLQKLYAEAAATRGWRHGSGKPSHVAIWLFESRAHYDSHYGQYIAKMLRIGEKGSPEVEIKTDRIAQLGQPEVERLGMTEAQRRAVFQEIVTSDDKAEEEARRKWPDPTPEMSQKEGMDRYRKQSEASEELSKRGRAALAKRYGIRTEELESIGWEGMSKDWPFPPAPKP